MSAMIRISAVPVIAPDLGPGVSAGVEDGHIDYTMPGVERQEGDLAERMDQGTDRLNERADQWAARSAATRNTADDVFNSIPMGQPMLVSHHSYSADRNRRERAGSNLGKSIERAGPAGRGQGIDAGPWRCRPGRLGPIPAEPANQLRTAVNHAR